MNILKSPIFNSLVLRGASVACNFALSVLLARFLGAKAFGVYSFYISILFLAVLPLASGISLYTVRNIAAQSIRKLASNTQRMLSWLLIVSICLSVFIMLVVGIVWFSLSPGGFEQNQIFTGLILSVPFLMLYFFYSGVIRGRGYIIYGQLPDAIFRPTTLIFLLALLIILNGKVTAGDAVLLHAIAIIITFGVTYFIGKHKQVLGKTVQSMNIRYGKAPELKSLMLFISVGGIQLAIPQLELIFSGLLVPPEKLGVYRVSVQLAALVVVGLTAVNQALHTKFAELYKLDELEALESLARRASRITLLLAVLPFVLFLFWGEQILIYLYGEEYRAAYMPLLILCLGQVINAGFGSVGALLNMTGNEKTSSKGMLIALALSIVLTPVLTTGFSINGTAAASAIALASWNIYMWYQVKIKLGIKSTAF